MKLLFLDIDGTLFGTDGKIRPSSIRAMKHAQEKGVTIILASGRDYTSLPWEQLKEVDIPYVITCNGSAAYKTDTKECLYKECLDREEMTSVFSYILDRGIHLNVQMNGGNYTEKKCQDYIKNMAVPDYVKEIIRNNCKALDDITGFIRENDVDILKVTLNFQMKDDGEYLNREETSRYLKQFPDIQVVDGGFANLEFNKAGISKATGVQFLSEYMGVSVNDVIAIGDSENDIEMLKTAGTGIAMGNAVEEAKAAADDITSSNDEDGVAKAIEKYLL